MRLGRVRLAGSMGQEDRSADIRRAMDLVGRYDALLSRLALAGDDAARGETVMWLGRADLPGSPAERYQVVVEALASEGPVDGTMFAKRLSDLNGVVEELDGRVSSAESSGTLPAPEMGAGSTTEEGTPEGKCLAGGVALLGLFVLPFIVH